jgi:hypothetical protein
MVQPQYWTEIYSWSRILKMNIILTQCVLACSIFSLVNGGLSKVADSLELADSVMQVYVFFI